MTLADRLIYFYWAGVIVSLVMITYKFITKRKKLEKGLTEIINDSIIEGKYIVYLTVIILLCLSLLSWIYVGKTLAKAPTPDEK